MTTITIKGTSYPFRLSYKALKSSLRQTKMKITDLENIGFDELEIFAVEAINNAYKHEGSDEKITREGLVDLIDEDMSVLKLISEAIGKDMESMTKPSEIVESEKK